MSTQTIDTQYTSLWNFQKDQIALVVDMEGYKYYEDLPPGADLTYAKIAYIRIANGPQIENLTPITDRVNWTFLGNVRVPKPKRDIVSSLMATLEDIRYKLSANNHPGTCGFLPQVVDIDYAIFEMQDYCEIAYKWTVSTEVTRGNLA